jgi:peptidoglycan/xylan/chitin deacetylase (PgdA/CDA1 family)
LIKTRILLEVLSLVFGSLMVGCSNTINTNIETIDSQLSITPSDAATTPATPFITITNTPMVVPPTFTPSTTNTPVPTETPISADTPIPTGTPALEWNQAGHVIAPILLYHHVSDDGPGNRYYVTLEEFHDQMVALRDWGYSTITAFDLAGVIINGGELPNRPVVITFDDGYVDIYQNAFPILQEMGFVGVFYIYVDHVGSRGYVNTEQIKVLADNGWEIGNHSMSHADLTINHSNLNFEVQQSRLRLEEAIGVKVETLSYPYGKVDDFVIKILRNYGYLAGMGLGLNWEHTPDTIFDLSRIEVQSDYNFSKFTSLLPWSGN